jgi:DNA topoisomerase-3
VKNKYYEMVGIFHKNGSEQTFRARYVPAEDIPVDSKGRVLDKNILSIVMGKVTGREGRVTKCTRKKGLDVPPLPYSLDTLQMEANWFHGFSPKTVLDTAQSLYEKKLTSYPRSDCNYIPTSQHEDGTKILKMLAAYGIPGAEKGSLAIRSRAFDDKRVTAYHAIVPTGVTPKELDDKEEALYKMISSRYVLQYLSPCEFNRMDFEVTVAGELFLGTGKLILMEGFREFFRRGSKYTENDVEQAILPDIWEGDAVAGNYWIRPNK